MPRLRFIHGLLAALVLLTATSACFAWTGHEHAAQDYKFELVERQVKSGYGASLLVRLVDERTGLLVPDAVLFISRLDMRPHGMTGPATHVEPEPDMAPGYYRFPVDLSMPGSWAMTLVAKVPGASGPVESKLVFEAVP